MTHQLDSLYPTHQGTFNSVEVVLLSHLCLLELMVS